MHSAEQMEQYDAEVEAEEGAEEEVETPEPEPYVPTSALIQSVADAMRPTGLRDRVRIRLAGGLTVFQVMDRMPESVLDELREGQEVPVLARRQAVYAIEHALYELNQQSRVTRDRIDMAMDLPGKGIRSVQIDVYKLI